jgi:hypothetical protein
MAREDWKPSDTAPFLVRSADRLYDECERAIREGRIDARSPIGDATLDYRDIRDKAAERYEGCAKRGGVCDCAGRPCAVASSRERCQECAGHGWTTTAYDHMPSDRTTCSACGGSGRP